MLLGQCRVVAGQELLGASSAAGVASSVIQLNDRRIESEQLEPSDT